MSEHQTCPVRSCGASLKRGYLMCREHWHLVPRALQRHVHATWRKVRGGFGDDVTLAEMREAIAAYRKATNAAVDAVEKSQP